TLRCAQESEGLLIERTAPPRDQIDSRGEVRITQQVTAPPCGGSSLPLRLGLLDQSTGSQVVAVLGTLAFRTLPISEQGLMGQPDARAAAVAFSDQQAALRGE